METFLLQATIFLAASVIAVPIASRLGLGSVLGYLAAGILMGPVLGLVGETESLQHVGEFGVVMMLFIIGLELEPRALWSMRDKLIGLGGMQIGATTAIIMAGAMVLGQPWTVALAIGLIFALSSTAIVLQTLNEKGLMQTSGGRSAFSVLLTQDIAVIPMLALLPLLALGSTVSFNQDGSISRPQLEQKPSIVQTIEDGHQVDDHATGTHAGDHGDTHGEVISLVDGLPAWGVTLVTLGAIIFVILLGVFVIPRLFRIINATRLRELNTALALLIVVGIASLMNMVGLSPALGAFLAGVVMASSEFRHELESDIEPFKGLLLGLFFITVGAGINVDKLFGDFGTIVGLTLAVIAIKAAVLFTLGRIFKLNGRNHWLFTLSLAQAGEFGFVLISFTTKTHVLPIELGETLLLVVALSMLITPALFILYEFLSRRTGEHDGHIEADVIDETGRVIIIGVGRFGQIVYRLLRSTGFSTVVLDNNAQTIQTMRRFGVKAFLGDPTNPDILHAAGLDDADIVVVAIDDMVAAEKIVHFARTYSPDIHIIARAVERQNVYALYQAGANDIVREMFDSSLRAGRYVLEHLGLTEFEAAEAQRAFYSHDRKALKELAALWKRDLPSMQNKDYMTRAMKLENELDTALLTQIEAARTKTAN